MSRLQIPLITLLCCCLFVFGGISGYYLDKPKYVLQGEPIVMVCLLNMQEEPVNEVELISIRDGIRIIEGSRYSHQFYLDNPELNTPDIGSPEHHRRCISDYNKVIDLLVRLEGN